MRISSDDLMSLSDDVATASAVAHVLILQGGIVCQIPIQPSVKCRQIPISVKNCRQKFVARGPSAPSNPIKSRVKSGGATAFFRNP